jgi:hypothetical protein
MRSFWFRDGEELIARRILDDPWWPQLRSTLERHDLLTVRDDVAASGGGGRFFHVRRKQELLYEELDDLQIRDFFKDLKREIAGARAAN